MTIPLFENLTRLQYLCTFKNITFIDFIIYTKCPYRGHSSGNFDERAHTPVTPRPQGSCVLPWSQRVSLAPGGPSLTRLVFPAIAYKWNHRFVSILSLNMILRSMHTAPSVAYSLLLYGGTPAWFSLLLLVDNPVASSFQLLMSRAAMRLSVEALMWTCAPLSLGHMCA